MSHVRDLCVDIHVVVCREAVVREDPLLLLLTTRARVNCTHQPVGSTPPYLRFWLTRGRRSTRAHVAVASRQWDSLVPGTAVYWILYSAATCNISLCRFCSTVPPLPPLYGPCATLLNVSILTRQPTEGWHEHDEQSGGRKQRAREHTRVVDTA